MSNRNIFADAEGGNDELKVDDGHLMFHRTGKTIQFTPRDQDRPNIAALVLGEAGWVPSEAMLIAGELVRSQHATATKKTSGGDTSIMTCDGCDWFLITAKRSKRKQWRAHVIEEVWKAMVAVAVAEVMTGKIEPRKEGLPFSIPEGLAHSWDSTGCLSDQEIWDQGEGEVSDLEPQDHSISAGDLLAQFERDTSDWEGKAFGAPKPTIFQESEGLLISGLPAPPSPKRDRHIMILRAYSKQRDLVENLRGGISATGTGWVVTLSSGRHCILYPDDILAWEPLRLK